MQSARTTGEGEGNHPDLAAAVLAGYEANPYPASDPLNDPKFESTLPDLHWLNVVGRDAESLPDGARILIAGCGVGQEAFNFARQLPNCQIVGVDFSTRAIETAQLWAKRRNFANLVFHQADLTNAETLAALGEPFDFISCHGVASYIPDLEAMFANLSSLLKADGVLYLGVNGSDHVSKSYRPLIEALGYDPAKMPDFDEAKKIIQIADQLAGYEDRKGFAFRGKSYLASDVFGPFIRALSMGEWLAHAQANGLTFLASPCTAKNLLKISDPQQAIAFRQMDLWRAHVIADQFHPQGFLTILLGKAGRKAPPFHPDQCKALRHWRPLAAFVDRENLPQPAQGETAEITVQLPIDLEANTFEYPSEIFAFLRLSDGSRTVEEIMLEVYGECPIEDLATLLFPWHISGMVHLCAPQT